MMYTPEDVKTAEQKLEEANNRLLIADQNYSRVKILHRSEETAIGELQTIKADLNKEVLGMIEKKNNLSIDTVNLQKSKDQLISEVVAAEKKLADSIEETRKQTEAYTKEKDLMAQHHQELDARQSSLEDREAKVTKWEEEIAHKYKKIKELAETL